MAANNSSFSWAFCGAGHTIESLKDKAFNFRGGKSGSGLDDKNATSKIDSQSSWWLAMKLPNRSEEPIATPDSAKLLQQRDRSHSTKSSESSPKAAAPPDGHENSSSWRGWPYCHEDTTEEKKKDMPKKGLIEMVEDACANSPFQPRKLAEAFDSSHSLGISPMEPPVSSRSDVAADSSAADCSVKSTDTPADRRRQRHIRRQQTVSIQRCPTPHEDFECTQSQIVAVKPKIDELTLGNSVSEGRKQKTAPLDSFILDRSTAVEMERTISELTMRSSYGVATAKLSENRRMAYYAVGKHHRQSGRGGNRRCYFTGKLILTDAPFYAGSVQQGLRTLVVFCLPSSLGLPKGSEAARAENGSVLASLEGGSSRISRGGPVLGTRSILSRNKGSKAPRSNNFQDEISLSVGEELDPNWGLCREYLLSVLPNPNQELMDEMERRFPEQFETLPAQVRGAKSWRLYVKFCFFSGLPIAEGEMHYKVRDEVADAFGEEVILSHEVMEAVNGKDSAEILRLPNLKTFRYLRKHYSQQSAKLPEEVFQRRAWELVRPEV